MVRENGIIISFAAHRSSGLSPRTGFGGFFNFLMLCLYWIYMKFRIGYAWLMLQYWKAKYRRFIRGQK